MKRIMDRSILLLISGPDPKRVKAAANSSSFTKDGTTVLSTTGYLWGFSDEEAFVTAPLSSFASFFASSPFTSSLSRAHEIAPPTFLPGVNISCHIEGKEFTDIECLSIIPLPDVEEILNDLLNAPSASTWKLGWQEGDDGLAPVLASSMVLLRIPLMSSMREECVGKRTPKNERWPLLSSPSIVYCGSARKEIFPGQEIYCFGYPFGAVVGQGLGGFCVKGVISSSLTAVSQPREGNKPLYRDISSDFDTIIDENPSRRIDRPVILADIRCPPGMEGGPVVAFPLKKETSRQSQHFQQRHPHERHALSVGMDGNLHDPMLVGFLVTPVRCSALSADFGIVVAVERVQLELRKHLALQNRKMISKLVSAPLPSSVHGSLTPDRDRPDRSGIDCPPLQSVASIVAVEIDHVHWASGIIVDPRGFVLTTAHALPVGNLSSPSVHHGSLSTAESCRIRIGVLRHDLQQIVAAEDGPVGRFHLETEPDILKRSSDDHPSRSCRWFVGRLVHCFAPPFDLAVFRIVHPEDNERRLNPKDGLRFVSASFPPLHHQAVIGTPVFVCGCPLWRPRSSVKRGLHPVITHGNVSKIVFDHRGDPAVVMTTAAVHAGASGGAVIDATTGHVVGLVTSNTRLVPSVRTGAKAAVEKSIRDTELSSPPGERSVRFFPHVNYALPWDVLRPIVRYVQETYATDQSVSSVTSWNATEEHPKCDARSEGWKEIEMQLYGPQGPSQVWEGLLQDSKNSKLRTVNLNKGKHMDLLPPKLASFLGEVNRNYNQHQNRLSKL